MRSRGFHGRLVLLALAVATPAQAADHFDGPAATEDPGADISDVYAWMSGDATRLIMVMNIVGDRFQSGVQYALHVEGGSAFGAVSPVLDVLCTFDGEERASCWARPPECVTSACAIFVRGDARERAITSEDGRLRLFAGRRRDPFFFNAEGFATAITRTVGAAPSLTFDAAGCPQLDGDTALALVRQLRTDPFGGPPESLFAGRRVSSLVVELDKTLATANGEILAISGSTRR